jgi:K+-sensing histidine kinase KdpD
MVTKARSELQPKDLAARAKPLRGGAPANDGPSTMDGLAALLAHDLNTSLASIAMNLDFAISELRESPSRGVVPALEDCRQANAHAIRMVSDMADAARLAVGNYRPILAEACPGQLLEKSVRVALGEAESRGIGVVVSTDRTRLVIDAELLSRVIDRLLERAVRQAQAGTRIDVQQKDRALSIRARVGAGAPTELTARHLTRCFAEAAMAVLGGKASVESPEPETIAYSLSLPGT